MKLIGAVCILTSAILWLLGNRRAGEYRLALYRESIEFLEFTRNKVFLSAMPIPEIQDEYHIAHPKSLLFRDMAESPISDYLHNAGETGMEGELRRIDFHLNRLSDTLKAAEKNFYNKNRLAAPLLLSIALILILILL